MDEEIRGLIESAEGWHVLVLGYGATHGVLSIALHHGDFPRHEEVICGGTSYFCGELAGGPYALTLIETPRGSETNLVIRSRDERFIVKCARVSRGKGRA